MTNRRQLLLALGAALLPASLRAQQLARVGVLDPSPTDQGRARLQGLRSGLKDAGLEEGRHYVLEYRSAEGRFERLGPLAEELVRLPVQVIVARNTPGVLAARAAAGGRLPIVMADVGDPLGLGFVKSMSRPGGNITGLSNATIELIPKRLELLREAFPGLKRVAVLGNPEDQNTPHQVSEARRALRKLPFEVRVFEARNEAQLGVALEAMPAWKAQAVVPLVNPHYRNIFSPRLIAWSAQRRIPVVHAFREEVDAGGLMAYSADISNQYQRVGLYVAKLLRGADPAALAVERPVRFELSLNLKTAAAIGVTFPQALLVRADRVIE